MNVANDPFSFSTVDLKSNESQLLDGFTIIESKIDIENYFEENTVSCFFNYVTKFTNANYGADNVTAICRFFIDHQFDLVLTRLNGYFSETCQSLKLESETVVERRKTDIFIKIHDIMNFMFAYSRKFTLKIYEKRLLKDWCEYLQNDEFLSTFRSDHVLQVILMNISLLSREADLYKSDWIDLNVVSTLLKVSEMDAKLKPDAYSTILRVTSDQQIAEIEDIFAIASRFIKLLRQAALHIHQHGDSLQRHKVEYYIDQTSKEFDVYCVPDDENPNDTWDTTALINTLYKLAVNDRVKFDLFEKYAIKEPIRTLILKGTEIEKRFALRLLAQLCYDVKVAALVIKDGELIKYLRSLCVSNRLLLKSIVTTSKQILWLLNSNNMKSVSSGLRYYTKQVMISFNSASKELSVRIKSELEKAGYKVWIDANEVHNSSLDTMASAIETSEFVLLCLTEKYRQSINCQSEAQYAFKRQKQIIPIVMQRGYESVGGWLGKIIADRVSVNFAECPFDEAMSTLLNRLVLIHSNNDDARRLMTTSAPVENKRIQVVEKDAQMLHGNAEVAMPKVLQTPPKVASTSHPCEWTDDEVKNWFESESNSVIYDQLKPCNGQLLYEYYEFQTFTPKFFYDHLSVDLKADRRSIVLFSRNLKKLFSTQKAPKEKFFSARNMSFYLGLVIGVAILAILIRLIS